jgi:biopolymer transport protein ExbD
MRRRKRAHRPIGFNVTTLLDVVLVLLMFVVVAGRLDDSAAREKDRSLPVYEQPPAVPSAGAFEAASPVVLSIRRDGKFLLDGADVKDHDLVALLSGRKRSAPNLDVVVQPHGQSTAARFALAVSLCRQAGIDKARLHVRQEGGGK